MGLRRWIQKYVYRLVREEEELQEQATGWQRTIAVTPCVYCQRPIESESLFCKYCGFALAALDQRTTGAQALVRTLPIEKVETTRLRKPRGPLTAEIEAALNPRDKYPRMTAYNRLKNGVQG